MKRKLSCILICLLVLGSCLGLSACSNGEEVKDYTSELEDISSNIYSIEKELDDIESALHPNEIQYNKIALTTLNCNEYLSINSYFGEMFIMEVNVLEYVYRCYANYYIETYPSKSEVYFENVQIGYAISIPTMDTYCSCPSTQLSFNGLSKCSVGATEFSDDAFYCFPSSSVDYITITSISGYVLVPK